MEELGLKSTAGLIHMQSKSYRSGMMEQCTDLLTASGFWD